MEPRFDFLLRLEYVFSFLETHLGTLQLLQGTECSD